MDRAICNYAFCNALHNALPGPGGEPASICSQFKFPF